ncbi:hypothetical protein HNY73_007686 [Argiope bruennichi]|uniref:Uncharacterized protein n=1 Tax=Argiope bruennichi TaxID=94029 RepID=A0A8T0FLV3_ARGBR|nr:hypothetical protein HNY73_007686 [Argiope bruennichi]
MRPGQERMEEMKAGLEKEMRSGQERMEEMKAGLEKEMRPGQERMEVMKAGLEKEIRSGQERIEQELKKNIASVKEEFSNIIQEKMNAIEDKVSSFENKVVSVETKVLKMEESIDKVREDLGKEFEQKFGKEIESLKKQISHEHEIQNLAPSTSSIVCGSETQKALRLADAKDIGSALVLAHKIKVAQQATRKDRRSIRAVFAADSDSDFVKQIDDLRRIIRRLKGRKDGRSTEIRCWTCGLTECVIPGLVADNRKFRFGVMDYPDTGLSCARAGVLVASSVVDLSKSVIPVKVANISDKTKIIQKEEVLATCTPVTCIDRKCNSQDVSSDDLVQNLLQDTDLDEKQRCAAREMIKEFQDLFSRKSEYFGRTQLVKHRIDTRERPPIRQHPKRLP